MPTISDFRFITYADTMQGFLLMQTKAKMLQENNHEWKKSMNKNLAVMEFNFGSKCKPSEKLLSMREHLSMSARS